jgi:aspartyl/glutamyl-tRNA(Asn/Gln) amidotransferase C subunit
VEVKHVSRKRLSAEREVITREIFEHLVELAAFELEPEEAVYLRRELNQQLDAIRELDAIEVDETTPITSHGVPYTSTTSMPLRPDEERTSAKADDILAQAPEVRHRYIVVPDIPHEALE